MNYYGILLVLLISIIGTSGCDQRTEYEKMLDRELSSNVEKDTLFLGYELGMSREQFYKHSWELNQKKLVQQGLNNQSVMYDLEELPHPAVMYFSPEFEKEQIYQMKVQIQYKGWAPWNKEMSADSLQLDVLGMLKQWYGDGFVKINDKKGDPTFAKVDGNREIRLTIPRKDASVWVYFTDLEMVRKMNNSNG